MKICFRVFQILVVILCITSRNGEFALENQLKIKTEN
jgi:hypothetical protein